MKKRALLLVVFFSLVSIGLSQTNLVASRDSTPDLRVAKLLKEAKMRYMVDDTGDYLVSCQSFVSNQTRDVWINSRTTEFGELEIRSIWSVAYRAPGKISADDARNFLERNNLIKIGSWHLIQYPDRYVMVFTIKADANQTASSLKEMIYFVYITADGVAKEVRDGRLKDPGE